MTLRIETDGKSAEDRAYVLELMLSMREEIARAAPAFEDGFARLSRKHDLVVSGPAKPNDSVRIGSGSHPPRLAVTIDASVSGRLPEEPFARALTIIDHGIALSREAPIAPEDDRASELALLVSHELIGIGASVAVRRPVREGGRAAIEIASTCMAGNLKLKPGRTGDGPLEPVYRRLDVIAERATPRLIPAVHCHWQALPGGGRTLNVRPSRASAIWRPERFDAVAALRMHAGWAEVLAP